MGILSTEPTSLAPIGQWNNKMGLASVRFATAVQRKTDRADTCMCGDLRVQAHYWMAL